MRKNSNAHFLFSVLFFLPILTFSQTVIREKVTIKPKIKTLASISGSTENLYTVNFTVTWESNVEGAIEIRGASSGWVYGGASLSVESPCQTSFIGEIKLNIPEFETHYFNYSLEVVGVADTSGTGSLVGTNPFAVFGWPPTAYISLPINNYTLYTVGFWNESLTEQLNQLCRGSIIVPWLKFHHGCYPLTTLINAEYINLKIEPLIQGVSFYDSRTGEELGSDITVRINESTKYEIKLNDNYENINGDTVTVISNIEGIERTDSIIVPATHYSLNAVYYDPYIIHGLSNYVVLETRPSSCLNIPLPPSIKFNVEIIEGANLATLLNVMTGEKGDTLNNIDHYEGWLEFELVGEGDIIDRNDTILVKASTASPQIEAEELLFIFQPPKLVVTFSPDVIAPGDTANVILKKKNDDGTLVDFPADQYFDVNIKEGAAYGTLYLPQWGDQSDEFLNIPAGFKFIASEQITESMVESTILVKTSSGIIAGSIQPGNPGKGKTLTNKSIRQLKKTANMQEGDEVLWGEGTITIGGETKIKITLTGPKEIWPYKAVSAGYNPITNVKIKVTNGDQPQANQSVKITIKRIERTGGHDHPNSSDLTLWGRISVNGVKGNPVTAYTDQNGEITTEEIRASEFGGEYLIEASLESKPGTKDTASLIVGVPGLIELGTSSYYELVGSPNNYAGTNDPCRFQPPTTKHGRNHFGKQGLINIITNIANDFAALYPGHRLRVNDMSLENGGLFDFQNTWLYPHRTHRVGNNADIPFSGINSNGQCIILNRRDLYNTIMDNSNRAPFEEGDHYHIYNN